MAKGHEGFISIYENLTWLDGEPINPQALWVESESLGLVPDIKHKDDLAGASRASQGSSFELGPVKPSGAITVPLRASDSYKLLYSHFQYGSNLGTDVDGNQQWRFYPSAASPNFDFGLRGDGPYGGTGYVFPVTVLKKYNNKNASNAQWFHSGVTDSLEFTFSSEETSKVKAEFKFATFYNGTNLGSAYVPGGTLAGTYSYARPFEYWHGTVVIGGMSLEITDLTFQSKNNLEEKTILGRSSPWGFGFGKYSCEGYFSLDMPDDGLRYIGSALTNSTFAITGSFLAGTNAMTFSMPYCRYRNFDVLPNNQNATWRLRIPFSALENGGTAPITVGVTTFSDASVFLIGLDAVDGTRTVGGMYQLDAVDGTRTISSMIVLRR